MKIISLKKKIKLLRNEAINRHVEIKEIILNELRTKSGINLDKIAERWQDKIKIIGLKSFKVSWFRGIKGPSDVVDTDNTGKAMRKFYFNKAVFSIPPISLNFTKKNFAEFEPGFYDYIDYLMDKIEEKKQIKNKKYSIDRTIFLVTSSEDMENINLHENIIAINTDGQYRPTYKGTPEYLDDYDLKKIKEYMKNNPDIPISNVETQKFG
jgi:hypothetical protein